MFRQAAILAFTAAVVLSFNHKNPLDSQWNAFKDKFGKKYLEGEERKHMLTWLENIDANEKHNRNAAEGKHTYMRGINEYSDLTQEEINTKMNGFKGVQDHPLSGQPFVEPADAATPDTLDWRTKGIITPVKNQGQCGSCWAFSSTGALEAATARKTGTLTSLSEQNLVDCCKTNSGCGGGWMDNAFNYVKTAGGIDTEKYYPYLGQNWYCFFNSDPADVGAHDVSHVDIPKGNETALKIAVATHGPVSVAIDATQPGFANYKSGVYSDDTCSSVNLDHAVLVIGYGTLNGVDYWLVKNSWGESYGDKGYIRMARNRNNFCGIATAASYPTV